MGTQKNRLNESVLLSTQNICLNWLVRTYLQFYAQKLSLSKPVHKYKTCRMVNLLSATGYLTWESFKELFERKVREDEDEKELREAFRVLDSNKKGVIPVEDLRWILKSLGNSIITCVRKYCTSMLIYYVILTGFSQYTAKRFSLMLPTVTQLGFIFSSDCLWVDSPTHWLGAKIHLPLCVDLYSGRIIVFFYDLDDSMCYVTCVIAFWT